MPVAASLSLIGLVAFCFGALLWLGGLGSAWLMLAVPAGVVMIVAAGIGLVAAIDAVFYSIFPFLR